MLQCSGDELFATILGWGICLTGTPGEYETPENDVYFHTTERFASFVAECEPARDLRDDCADGMLPLNNCRILFLIHTATRQPITAIPMSGDGMWMVYGGHGFRCSGIGPVRPSEGRGPVLESFRYFTAEAP